MSLETAGSIPGFPASGSREMKELRTGYVTQPESHRSVRSEGFSGASPVRLAPREQQTNVKLQKNENKNNIQFLDLRSSFIITRPSPDFRSQLLREHPASKPAPKEAVYQLGPR